MSYISELHNDHDELNFTLHNVETSYANALRRSILSMIPVVGLKTEPNENNQMIIYKNTSKLNNEIMKHRLSCVPIHMKPTNDIQRYSIYLHIKNDTDNIIEVTTKDILIKDTQTDKYLTEKERDIIFPANLITKDYILLTRLYPRIHVTSEPETLHLECPLSICYAYENSVYNAVSTCSYGFTPDKKKQQLMWEEAIKNNTYKEEDKINWLVHDSKRYFLPNSFDFKIKTVGVYSNIEIVTLGCQSIINNLQTYLHDVQKRSFEIKPGETLEKSYDIKLNNDNYTMGKILENTIYTLFFLNESILSFVAYKKPHPHVDYGIIRIMFKEEEMDETNINKILFESILHAKNIFEHISQEISSYM